MAAPRLHIAQAGTLVTALAAVRGLIDVEGAGFAALVDQRHGVDGRAREQVLAFAIDALDLPLSAKQRACQGQRHFVGIGAVQILARIACRDGDVVQHPVVGPDVTAIGRGLGNPAIGQGVGQFLADGIAKEAAPVIAVQAQRGVDAVPRQVAADRHARRQRMVGQVGLVIVTQSGTDIEIAPLRGILCPQGIGLQGYAGVIGRIHDQPVIGIKTCLAGDVTGRGADDARSDGGAAHSRGTCDGIGTAVTTRFLGVDIGQGKAQTQIAVPEFLGPCAGERQIVLALMDGTDIAVRA